MPRLFTGLEIRPRSARRFPIAGWPSRRPLDDPENYHVTLRFIGEIDGVAANEIASLLFRVNRKPFEVAVQVDDTLTNKDNFFARYSYGNDSNFLPSPFNNVLDGGSFQDGYSNNTAQGLAASEIHTFRNNLINEFRFGFNHLNSHRYNLNYNVNVAQQLPPPFPGVPFDAGQNIGGLPSH